MMRRRATRSPALRAVVASLLILSVSCARHRPDGTVRIGFPIDPSTLNQIFATQLYEQYLACMIFSGLTTTDARGNMAPDLAETVPSHANGGISADGLTITYRLRPGLRWQDGKPLTAADVAFTFSLIHDPKSEAEAASNYANVASVVARDSRTVVFHLKRPQANALTSFFRTPGGAILPQHLLQSISDLRHAAFNAHPVGSGPYVVESWARGTDLQLRANHLYFRGSPQIERLRIEFLPDANTRVFEALSGNLDVAAGIAPRSAAELGQGNSLRIFDVPEPFLSFLAVRVNADPLDDPRVRRALGIAADRGAIVRKAYLGYASPAVEFVPPWTQYATVRAYRPQDLGEAAALLDRAGWRVGPDGVRERAGRSLELALTFNADSASGRTAALLLQSEWRRLGINVALRGVHTQALFALDGVLARGNFQVALYANGFLPDSDPNRDFLFSSRMIPPAGDNYARYRNPVVDAAVLRGNESLDPAVRAKAYATIAKQIATDAPYIPLVWMHDIFAVSQRLAGAEPVTAGSEFCRAYGWRLR